MSSFDPDGPIGQKFKPALVTELTKRFGIADDAEDVAEFILVLVGSNKSATEITAEVTELIDIPMNEQFAEEVLQELGRLMEENTQNQTNNRETQNVGEPANTNNDDNMARDDKPQFATAPKSMRTDNSNQFKGNRGGISKNNNRNIGKRGIQMKSPEELEKILNMSNANVNLKNFLQKPRKPRCQYFPDCSNKDCEFAHPTKLCFAFPKCSNPPGTCNYLHPGEDDELMERLEKSKQQYLEKKKKTNSAGSIGICKYGILCSKEVCPFGHPTPANNDAKVLVLEWCPAGRQCQDVSCEKAHPSPVHMPLNKPSPVPQFTLEQCKYDAACTNFKCPRRHATTPVPCREGSNCVRIDCFFAHPIDEDCRFGINCTNKVCMFRHPEGRSIASNTWTKDSQANNTAGSSNERAFAVPEDQVMEHAVQES